MQLIKKIMKIMDGNVGEAERYISKAYALREKNRAVADWYKEMASAHLGFNANGNALIKRCIDEYRMSDMYKEHPQYADGMIDAWKDLEADLAAKSAEVKAMIDAFK